MEHTDLDVRPAALRAGLRLGWSSVAAVLAALVLDLPVRHTWILVGLIIAAAVANAAVALVPGRWWSTARRGQRMLDLWSAGLIGLVVALVMAGGAAADLDLLLFLIVPFLATVHTGRRQVAWLGLALAAGVTLPAVAPDALTAGEVALRGCLLAAAAMLAILLGRFTRRAAAARAESEARVELERTLLAEAHHRVKNSLQTVADLLLLGRPDGETGRGFDETAARIQAIAAVHNLLAEDRGSHVEASRLLELIAQGVAPEATIEACEMQLQADRAQHFGVVANELLANAVEHGRAPVVVRLVERDGPRLIVEDAGELPDPFVPGLGLQLVERVVEQGLHGTFEIDGGEGRGTRAEVVLACAS